MAHDPRKRWRVPAGKVVRLADIDPGDTSGLPDKDEAKERLAEDADRIDELQDILFAERERALLVILQGMDTSGKDGTTKAVFRATGPLGVTVTSFGRPSADELAHDFLWRVHAACPGLGTIAIFNRSHYEDVLVGRVRKLAPPEEIERRYDAINAFEGLLAGSGTTILKFMLHISKDEQRKRLQARLDDPKKRWKFDPGDLEDRALFERYMDAYDQVLERCSTKHAPWHVIPSNHKWARNAAVAAVIRRTLEHMDPRHPEVAWDPADYSVV
jgi:PPK2 family polyphosphate:nucleotide phosphotransferase